MSTQIFWRGMHGYESATVPVRYRLAEHLTSDYPAAGATAGEADLYQEVDADYGNYLFSTLDPSTVASLHRW